MDHRYGRHGPDAWLKWRARHYVPPTILPIPTSSTKVYVYELSQTERIIYIVANPSDDDDFERDGTQQREMIIGEVQNLQALSRREVHVPQRPPTPQPPTPLQQIAYRRASDDISKIERLIRAGKDVTLDPDGLEDRTDQLARDDISDEYVASHADTYEDLISEYQDAYRQRFQEKLAEIKHDIPFLRDGKEKELRAVLREDRPTVKNRLPGDHHARDLALVRILQVYHPYELMEITSKTLSDLHASVDFYEKYVLDTEGRNEVVWPDLESF
jgi:hypothetical protein